MSGRLGDRLGVRRCVSRWSGRPFGDVQGVCGLSAGEGWRGASTGRVPVASGRDDLVVGRSNYAGAGSASILARALSSRLYEGCPLGRRMISLLA